MSDASVLNGGMPLPLRGGGGEELRSVALPGVQRTVAAACDMEPDSRINAGVGNAPGQDRRKLGLRYGAGR